jgi:hypothetical protein
MVAHRLPLSLLGEVMVAIFQATIKELPGDYGSLKYGYHYV